VKVSVVIPALNEADNLGGAIDSVGQCHEVIVADGSSVDATRELAASLGAVVVTGPAGRGLQMDSGAAAATGEVLLFLHADSRLPRGWLEDVEKAVSLGCVAGAFSLSFGPKRHGAWMALVERVANLRARFGLIYGDQAIFAERKRFVEAGGFRAMPLMEDVDFIRRVKKLGRVVVLPGRIITSTRRWSAKGRLSNTLKNWLMLSLYYAGVEPARLYRLYYKK